MKAHGICLSVAHLSCNMSQRQGAEERLGGGFAAGVERPRGSTKPVRAWHPPGAKPRLPQTEGAAKPSVGSRGALWVSGWGSRLRRRPGLRVLCVATKADLQKQGQSHANGNWR